jgi:LPS sulfotransferase NodH
MRYEDLVQDPVGVMERMYAVLGLDEFEQIKPGLERYLAQTAGYKTNRYRALDPRLQAEIDRRWAKVIRHYGYERQPNCN